MADTMRDGRRLRRNVRLTAAALALFAAAFYLFTFLRLGA